MKTVPEDMLIIGASSGIAGAVMDRFLEASPGSRIICVSRSPAEDAFLSYPERISWVQSDYSDVSIERICLKLADDSYSPSRVVICNGMLHSDAVSPEKRLEDVETKQLVEVFSVNAVLPILWLKHLLPVVSSGGECRIAILSARVGSISDNRLGGWYSYRASKAALNMLLKTVAIEYARRARKVKLLAFHPGTTDTELSRPFQPNVPNDKLFSPEFVATRLLDLIDALPLDGELSYRDWDGKPIDW